MVTVVAEGSSQTGTTSTRVADGTARAGRDDTRGAVLTQIVKARITSEIERKANRGV